MKYAARIVLAALVLFATIISIFVWRAASTRHADVAYHAALAKTLAVGSETFSANGEIPTAFTCRGSGNSPELKWDHVPPGTQSFVLTMVDWDAPTSALRLNAFTHWILYNIPGEHRAIAASTTDDALRREHIAIGENSSDTLDYVPPCPQLGKHRYSIRVYALDVARILPSIADSHGIQNAMRGHIIAYGEISGLAGR